MGITFWAAVAAAGAVPDIDIQFKEFIDKYNKEWNYSEEDLIFRKAIFTNNMNYINKENAKGSNPFTLGITKFSAMTNDEFRALQTLNVKDMPQNSGKFKRMTKKPTKEQLEKLPASHDWRDENAVTEVKNQGSCGSCWSFSTAGALEGSVAIKKGVLANLSEQNLLDCDTTSSRCNGGWMDAAFMWVNEHGLCSYDSYPYKCSRSTSRMCRKSKNHPDCKDCKLAIQPGEVQGFVDVTPKDPEEFKYALTENPLSVAIEAGSKTFQHYKTGILPTGTCGHNLNHGVLAVAYGEEKGMGYFTIKNSWGSGWGEGGYIRVQSTGHGVPEEGTCGILLAASYPYYEPDTKEKEIIQ